MRGSHLCQEPLIDPASKTYPWSESSGTAATAIPKIDYVSRNPQVRALGLPGEALGMELE
jgi:hypothetical protein